ncbi:hypothetical protein D16iCDA_02010 [Pseudomonas seleniipraecipitans]|uniref:Uncharacterized protein n=1 Tax=Phytopseudomonas seleniipraecipitans TaxID=640205 RepID=A0ABY5JA54_9GAMM|nr:hypothetical protein [Pseudomonas seleniipraecipitans]UUD64505.1 hypothetical protein D16iCDA_02010 [Pseudomonas seleniipraecipitans]
MGLFRNIKNTYKQSEAAVVVQNLLEHQCQSGMYHADAAKSASSLVAVVWAQKPDIFSGVFGQRPHKISVAAAALANGVFNLPESNTNRAGLVMALGELLAEVDVNERLYGFNGVDHELLGMALSAFDELYESI